MIEPQMKTPPADVKATVTDKYTQAYNLNVRICVNAQMAQQNLYEVCKGLKEMRDGKLYKELGYNSFDDYTENEVGLSRFMAYKYAAIADMKNVESIQQIGVTKLALLAKLDEPQREEIQQTVNVEDISVRELKAEIAKLNEEKAGYQERQEKLLTRNKELVQELSNSEDECSSLGSDLDEAKETVASLKKQLHEQQDNYNMHTQRREERIADLETKIKELEKRPVEVAVQTEIKTDITAVFNAYAQAATDAMKHLTQFCEKNSNSNEKNLFVSKLKMIVSLTEQSIKNIGGI